LSYSGVRRVRRLPPHPKPIFLSAFCGVTAALVCAGIILTSATFAALRPACWFYSAWIEVPNNIDTIVGELQRIGYWNGFAAGASCAAALLLGPARCSTV
jgi:hypothetical protein